MDGLSINFAGGLLHARFTDFDDLDTLNPGAGIQDLSGQPLMRAPNWTLSAGAQYEAKLSFGSLTFRGDIYATDDYSLRPYPDARDRQKSYASLGGSITYRSPDERWSVRGWLKNATNKAALQGLVGAAEAGGRLGIFNAPRTYSIELSAEF